MRAHTKFRLALAAVLMVISQAWAETAATNAEEPVQSGIIPRYLLMNDRGQAVSDQDFPGRFQLISFGYTFCPDVCPTTLAEMSLILDKLGKKSRRMQALFVTLDPERDTPEVLRNYTAYFNSRIMGLSGSPELVRRAADNFKVRYEKHWEPGAAKDKYSVDHSAGMYLLGPDGRFLAKFAYATPPDQIAERILHLIDAQLAAPDRSGN
jgi:protein SCO1/2